MSPKVERPVLKVERVEVKAIKADPQNARRHPGRNVVAIAASLKAYGQRRPLVVNRKTGIIEAGNATYVAAKELGWTHVDVVYFDDDQKTAMAYALADNRTAELAEWDEVQLAEQLQALKGSLEAVGYDQAELDALMKRLAGPAAPDEFPTVDENLHTEHRCPKCGYEWSGKSS